MEYWTDLYKELAAKIQANLQEIAWIDLWHDQVSYLTEELPFTTPAAFLSFSTIAADDRSLLVQDVDTQIDIYLFYETFSDTYIGSMNQDTALEFLNSLTKMHALLHGTSGENYSSMRRVDMRREESGGAGNLYRISFQCNVVDYSAQVLFNESENPDAQLDIAKGGVPEQETDDSPLFEV